MRDYNLRGFTVIPRNAQASRTKKPSWRWLEIGTIYKYVSWLNNHESMGVLGLTPFLQKYWLVLFSDDF